MHWLHPIFQTLALPFAICALLLGWARFAAVHLARPGQFQWTRHVTLGSVALSIWLAGFFAGAGIAWLEWRAVFVTGLHARLGLCMVPFLAFGLVSGLAMHRKKKARRWLPLAHGLNNALLIPAAFVQLATGLRILSSAVFP